MSEGIRDFRKFCDDVRPVEYDGKPPAHEWLLFQIKAMLDGQRPSLAERISIVVWVLSSIMIPKKHIAEVISIVRELREWNNERENPHDPDGRHREWVSFTLEQLIGKLSSADKAGKYK